MFNRRCIGLALLLTSCLLLHACAKPLAYAKVYKMKSLSREMNAHPNELYDSVKWAFEECGYPRGVEDLIDGVIESKYVPTGAGSHYVDIFDGRDYGANASYYKMVIRIVPLGTGKSKVVARTDVKSLTLGMASTGDKEREILDKIQEHSRNYDITVTNLGVEE